MGMDRYELTKPAFGATGVSQAVNTVVATLVPGSRGRWEIKVLGRHTLADGLKISLTIGGVTTDLVQIPNSAGGVQATGNITIDLQTNADAVLVRLAVATGAADNASATIFAQKMAPN